MSQVSISTSSSSQKTPSSRIIIFTLMNPAIILASLFLIFDLYLRVSRITLNSIIKESMLAWLPSAMAIISLI